MIQKVRKVRSDHARRNNRTENNYDTFVYAHIF